MINWILLVILWLGQTNIDQATILSKEDIQYRAAKYKVEIDYSKIQGLMPGLPKKVTSFTYFIDYGNDLFIELRDPGEELDYMPDLIIRWDYKKLEFKMDAFFTHVGKTYSKTDSINIFIEDQRGYVEDMCRINQNTASSCDSVIYTQNVSNKEFLVYLDNNIKNLKFYSLFYPDLCYLPIKIEKKDKSRTIHTLEQMFYGKQSVDSLINSFDHIGYDIITEEEINSYELELPDQIRRKLE